MISEQATRVLLEAVEDPESYFETNPVATRDELLLSTLSDAIEDVEEMLGEDWDEWAWCDLKHAHFDHALLPGLDDDIASSLDIGPEPMGGSGYTVWNANYDFQLASGASWRMVIDVGEWNNSLAMSAPGQSGDPESEFYDNLVDPFLEGEYFPLLYTCSAVQQNTAKRINLVPNQNS